MDAFFDRLKRIKDSFNPKENQKLAEIRLLPSYQRLKSDFADKGVKSGDNFLNVTLGNILDILILYKETVGSRHDFSAYTRLANTIPQIGSYAQELDKLGATNFDFKDVDVDSDLYKFRPDLEKFMETQPMRNIDLTHYPGGLIIKEDGEGFKFHFTNRQNSDEGKPVNKIFSETGLPFDSQIKD